MYASSVINSFNVKKSGTKKAALSLGLALSFHPCMQDEKTMQHVLKNGEENVQIMLNKALDPVDAGDMLERLQKVLSKLNYNSHCKSIAVLLRPDEESVTYLNFPVKPVTYLNKSVSLLELTANTHRPADFYYLVLEQYQVKLYEYYNNHLNQVYASKQETGFNEKTNSDTLLKKVLQTIERLNANNEKPVFITGSPEQVEVFCSSSLYSGIFYRVLENAALFDEEIIQRLVKEIINHWKRWQSKFIMDQITITQKANVLIAEVEMVLQALRNGVDGLLLIDKCLKQRLFKSRRTNALFNTADEFMNQVERFLISGNRIEITETELLKEFGHIVLLQNRPVHFFPRPVCYTGIFNNPDTF